VARKGSENGSEKVEEAPANKGQSLALAGGVMESQMVGAPEFVWKDIAQADAGFFAAPSPAR
jgi:hypothetical protein